MGFTVFTFLLSQKVIYGKNINLDYFFNQYWKTTPLFCQTHFIKTPFLQFSIFSTTVDFANANETISGGTAVLNSLLTKII